MHKKIKKNNNKLNKNKVQTKIKERKRIFIDATHFAVSGKLREEMKKREA